MRSGKSRRSIVISILLLSVITIGGPTIADPARAPATPAQSCASAVALLYELGKVHASKGRNGTLSLKVWSVADPEARQVPRRQFNAPRACDRVRSIDIDMTRGRATTIDLRSANLAPLTAFPKLDSLSISGYGFVNSDLAPLVGLSNLEWLEISRTRLSDDGLLLLRGLPRLTILELKFNWVRGRGLIHLRAPTRLKRLTIKGKPFGDSGMVHVGKMTGLNRLKISETGISNKGMKHLARLTALRKLNISQGRMAGHGLRHLARLAKLRELNIVNTRITHVGFKHLAQLPKLEDIDMNGGQITNQVLRELTRFKNWKRLQIGHHGISIGGGRHGGVYYGLKSFTSKDGRNYLTLTPTRTTGAALLHLRGLKIARLELSHFMNDGDLAAAARLFPDVNYLSFGKRHTKAALLHLKPMRKLKTIDIGCTSLRPRDFQAVASIFPPGLGLTRFRCTWSRERFDWEIKPSGNNLAPR